MNTQKAADFLLWNVKQFMSISLFIAWIKRKISILDKRDQFINHREIDVESCWEYSYNQETFAEQIDNLQFIFTEFIPFSYILLLFLLLNDKTSTRFCKNNLLITWKYVLRIETTINLKRMLISFPSNTSHTHNSVQAISNKWVDNSTSNENRFSSSSSFSSSCGSMFNVIWQHCYYTWSFYLHIFCINGNPANKTCFKNFIQRIFEASYQLKRTVADVIWFSMCRIYKYKHTCCEKFNMSHNLIEFIPIKCTLVLYSCFVNSFLC